jgi:hypothetical protein
MKVLAFCNLRPPRRRRGLVQLILWRGWQGLGWRQQWPRLLAPLYLGSLFLGWIEVRVWR